MEGEAAVREPAGYPGLEIDDAAGVAWLRGVEPAEYGQRYWDECLEYHNSPIAERLTELRVEMVRRHERRVGAVGLVDVGIGSGRFLEAYQFAADRPAWGFDVNPRARDWLVARGLFRSRGDLPRTEYVAVTMWDVFEHLEPAQLVAWLESIAPHRMLFLSLPIYADFRELPLSKHFKPGEHLSYWTHDGLLRYLLKFGFECVESNDFETQAGRESIRSYAFFKWPLFNGQGAPGRERALLITNGIGDFLAAESFLSERDRQELNTVYYATGEHRAIRELLEAFAGTRAFPNLKHHVVLWDEWDEETFCFADAADVAMRVRVPPGVQDFSIARVFPEVVERTRHHTGSTALRYKLADLRRFELPRPQSFVVVCPETTDNTPPERNFTEDDWIELAHYLRSSRKRAIILGRPRAAPGDADLHEVEPILLDPRLRDLFLDFRGRTMLPESIELLKRASGYIGIDSCLSVLAARLFKFPDLAIKCLRPAGGLAWASVYWYPRARFLQPPATIPFLGSTIGEVLGRAAAVRKQAA